MPRTPVMNHNCSFSAILQVFSVSHILPSLGINHDQKILPSTICHHPQHRLTMLRILAIDLNIAFLSTRQVEKNANLAKLDLRADLQLLDKLMQSDCIWCIVDLPVNELGLATACM